MGLLHQRLSREPKDTTQTSSANSLALISSFFLLSKYAFGAGFELYVCFVYGAEMSARHISRRPVLLKNGFACSSVLDSSVDALLPRVLGSPLFNALESYYPGPGRRLLIFASLQFGTLLEKIELPPAVLQCFLSLMLIGSYLPGPGFYLSVQLFSYLFSYSKIVRFDLEATKSYFYETGF